MPLTPGQKAIIKQRALKEMRHRAVGVGFRPAVLRGDWSETARKSMRADTLSRRAESVAGSRLVARDPHATNSAAPIIIGVLAVSGGVAIGYVIGKWLKKKSHTVGGSVRSSYLTGLDVMCLPRAR